MWLPYSIAGGWSINVTLFDSTYQNSSDETERFIVKREAAYHGKEQVVTPAGVYETHKFTEVYRLEVYLDGEPDVGQTTETTLWFSNDLGNTVQGDQRQWIGPLDDQGLVVASRDVLVKVEQP